MTARNQPALPDPVVEAFARGLYHIAAIDGVEPREEKLIRDFLREAGSSLAYEDLGKSPIAAMEVAAALETSFLRRLFVRAAVAVVKADGQFTEHERRVLGEIADAFGMSNAEFGELEIDAARTRILPD